MVEFSEPSPDTAPVRAPKVLVAAASGQGGVAATVERVMQHLPGALRMDVSPLTSALARVGRGRYDVLHLHPSLRWRAVVRDTALAQVARGRGKRVVVQWHGWDHSLRDRPLWMAGLLDGQHVVLTPRQRERLVEWGVDRARISPTVNPYDPESLPDVPSALADAESEAERRSVVFVGRWVEEKGIDLLIGAMAHLPHLTCEIAGEGPARASINAAIVRHRCADRVSLLGWLDAGGRKALWSRASVLVLPSSGEAYPLAVVEALAAGVPVVGTDVGAVPQLIEGAGVIVERSIEAVADGIRAVLERPPPRLAEIGARVRASHHPSEVARQWTAIHAMAAEGLAL